MFLIQENYFETQLLFQHLVNFIHRRSILGQTEMELKLLAYCTRQYDFNGYKQLLPLNLPCAAGEAWPLQILRTGHLARWRITIFFSVPLCFDTTGGFQANYSAKEVQQSFSKRWVALARRSRRTSWSSLPRGKPLFL